jgi:ABC-type amino acid transport substrate-binding protein
MKQKIIFIFALLLSFNSLISQTDSLTIYYYDNYPYAFDDNGTIKGIEIDIIKEYTDWLKQKKSINVVVSYKAFKEFSGFYNGVKNGGSKVIGLGSVTINAEREKEIVFSSAYLNNTPVLITDGRVPTIKLKNTDEISKVLDGLNALVVNTSSHMKYINDIKKDYVPTLKISFKETQQSVLEGITNDAKIFGYADIIAYWSFLKKNPNRFLKIQKVFNQPSESLGFIMPKKNVNTLLINEFFESGFGFTSTKTYHQILEKYLGYEIIESVEIK